MNITVTEAFGSDVYTIDAGFDVISVEDLELLAMAKEFVESKCRINDIAVKYGYSYSTIWRKFHLKLVEICPELHKNVIERIEKNKIERGLCNLGPWYRKHCVNYDEYLKYRRKN